MRAIAISDIHGCLKTFRALVEEKVQLTQDDTLYLLGDYIDRGPDSKGVIDYILELQKTGHNVISLTGNHEQMLLDALKGYSKRILFWQNGGKETLESYGLNFAEFQFHPHLEFFENLKWFIELDDYILVHAGFRFDDGGMFYNRNAMIWERNWYRKIDKTQLNGKIIVHGHTPQSVQDIKAMKHNMALNQYINIDAGCFRTGKMCALDLTNRELYFQDSLDIVLF